MQVTKEELNPCTLKLTVSCDPEQVKEGFEKAFKQLAKKVRLPGFRPGHAPRAIVEKYVQKGELYDAAAENIVRQAFKKALEQEEINPDQNTRPNVELSVLNDEEAKCEFTVKVPLPPHVELGDYKGLPVEKPPFEVTEEEVDYQLEEIRKGRSTREAVTDRGVQEGDVAVVNVKADGEAGEGRNFMTVAGKTFPLLDQALMGMKVEDTKSLDLTFPENFQEKDWAGKTFHAQVTLNSVAAVKTPELDDAFAKSLKTNDVKELRERITIGIQRAKEDGVREMVAEQLLDRLLERSKVNVSDGMWEQIAARKLNDMQEELKQADKTLEQHAAENGMTIDQFVDWVKDQARLHVQRALMIREIFTQEKMSLSNAELNLELQVMSNEYQVQPDEMLALLKKNSALEELHFRAISRKVADFLTEHADVKEVAMNQA